MHFCTAVGCPLLQRANRSQAKRTAHGSWGGAASGCSSCAPQRLLGASRVGMRGGGAGACGGKVGRGLASESSSPGSTRTSPGAMPKAVRVHVRMTAVATAAGCAFPVFTPLDAPPRCSRERGCGTACQKVAWPAHKSVCRQRTGSRPGASDGQRAARQQASCQSAGGRPSARGGSALALFARA